MRFNNPKRINALVDADSLEYLDSFARQHGLSRQSALSLALELFASLVYKLPPLFDASGFVPEEMRIYNKG